MSYLAKSTARGYIRVVADTRESPPKKKNKKKPQKFKETSGAKISFPATVLDTRFSTTSDRMQIAPRVSRTS